MTELPEMVYDDIPHEYELSTPINFGITADTVQFVREKSLDVVILALVNLLCDSLRNYHVDSCIWNDNVQLL